jgi:hypothetical protein
MTGSTINLHQTRPRCWARCSTASASVLVLLSLVVGVPMAAQQQAHRSAQETPSWIRRGQPNEGHALLRALAGTWRVEKSLFIAIGTPEQPATSRDLVARRRLIAGGRYLQDITEGPLAGSTYYRMGLLGYSSMDRRYEWVTVDGTNANMMIYLGDALSPDRLASPTPVISMTGTFTDQGLIGEETAGRTVAMRTVIQVEGADRHVIELYFTPPERAEMLIDRSVYTRLPNDPGR